MKQGKNIASHLPSSYGDNVASSAESQRLDRHMGPLLAVDPRVPGIYGGGIVSLLMVDHDFFLHLARALVLYYRSSQANQHSNNRLAVMLICASTCNDSPCDSRSHLFEQLEDCYITRKMILNCWIALSVGTINVMSC